VSHQSGTAAAPSNCHTVVTSLLNFWEASVTFLQLKHHITIFQEWQSVIHWIFWMCSWTFSFLIGLDVHTPNAFTYIYCKTEFCERKEKLNYSTWSQFPRLLYQRLLLPSYCSKTVAASTPLWPYGQQDINVPCWESIPAPIYTH
jgi:hypothetical protein